MRKLILSILLATQFLGINQSFAEGEADEEIQPGTGTITTTTTEEKDGKKIETTKTGKVKTRKGEPRVGQIDESEAGKYKTRYKALNLSSFGFGPIYSKNIGDAKVLYGLSVGKIWDLREHWNLKLDFSGAFNSKGSFMTGALGVHYLFNDTDISPFVGGLFGYGYANGNDSDKGAFSSTAEAGVRFFRLSETQLEIAGTYSTLFVEENLSIYGVQIRILY